MDRSRALVYLLPLALVACATSPSASVGHTPMTHDTRAAITSTQVVVGVDSQREQSQWTEQYVGNNQGGLLGALIASAIVSNLESNRQDEQRKLVSIRSATVKFNFGSRYRGALEGVLRPIAWLHTSTVSREPTFQQDKRRALLRQISNDTLLVSDAMYALAPDFATLTVTSSVGIYAKQDLPAETSSATGSGEADAIPPLYFNRFRFEYTIDPSAKPGAAWWADNDGAELTHALQAGIDAVVRMIAFDLESEPAVAPVGPIVIRGQCSGYVLREVDGREMLRAADGQLCMSTVPSNL